jgi:hypothetical protein
MLRKNKVVSCVVGAVLLMVVLGCGIWGIKLVEDPDEKTVPIYSEEEISSEAAEEDLAEDATEKSTAGMVIYSMRKKIQSCHTRT